LTIKIGVGRGSIRCMFTRISFAATLLFLLGVCAASSRAQIIYEPVQYQYGDQNKFYYGGTDARVFERAAVLSDPGAAWGRVNGNDFASGDVWVHREVSDQPVRVYSDALPTQNASLYGFTATDAANVANASVPRYFRKADVLAAASGGVGVLIVPARAIFPAAPAVGSSHPPTTQPAVILPPMIFQAPAPPAKAAGASDKLLMASH
jgi:hypothetical protein